MSYPDKFHIVGIGFKNRTMHLDFFFGELLTALGEDQVPELKIENATGREVSCLGQILQLAMHSQCLA